MTTPENCTCASFYQAKKAEWEADAYKEGARMQALLDAEAIQKARDEVAKAYGGCTKCYGKGYGTQIENYSSRGESDMGQGHIVINEAAPYYLPCSCDRGKQFKKAMAEARAAALKEALSLASPNVTENYMALSDQAFAMAKHVRASIHDAIKSKINKQ
jgi:hypothetical protein